MASVLQKSGKVTQASGSSLIFSFPSAPTVGNFIVILVETGSVVGGDGFGTVTDNATGGSNTYAHDVAVTNAGSVGVAVISAKIDRTKSSGFQITVPFTSTPNTGVGEAYEVTGLDATTWLDKHATNTGSSAISTTTSITPSQDGDFIAAIAALNSGSGAPGYTPPASPFVEDFFDDAASWVEDGGQYVQTTAAAIVLTWDWNGKSRNWGTAIAAYKASSVTNTNITPSAGSLTLSGAAPIVGVDHTLTPTVGSLTLTGYAPIVTNVGITPGAGSLVLTGAVPVIDQGLIPGTGALVLTGYAPDLGPTFVAIGSGATPNNNHTTNPLTVTFPATTQGDDLFIVIALTIDDDTHQTVASVAPSSGQPAATFAPIPNAFASFSNSAGPGGTKDQCQIVVWRATNIPANLTSVDVTVNASPSGTCFFVFPVEYFGVKGIGAIGTGGAHSTNPTISLQTTQDNSVVLAAFASCFDSGTQTLWSAASAGTFRAALRNSIALFAIDNLAGVIDTVVSAPAVATCTMTQSYSSPWAALAIELLSGPANPPATGALTLTGYAPTVQVSGGTSITPGAGSLALTGQTPTAPQGTVLTPTVGGLVLTGAMPSRVVGIVLTPGAGSLLLTGVAPSVVQGTVLTPSVSSLVLSGTTPRTDVGKFPASGSLVLTGQTPSVVVGTVLTPGSGALTLSGVAPSRVIGTILTPTVGSLVLAGIAPSIVQGTVLTPSVGALVLTGVAPTVLAGQAHITPGAGVLTLTGAAPTLLQDIRLTPLTGSLTLAGVAPTVSIGTLLTPTVGALILSGVTPSLVRGTVLTPASGALVLVGSAPSLLLDVRLTPQAGALVLTGFVPTLGGNTQITPAAGALALTGVAPRLDLAVRVLSGALVLTGAAPGVLNPIQIIVPSGALTLVGEIPILGGPVVRTPPTGALTLTGSVPTVVVSPTRTIIQSRAEYASVLVGAARYTSTIRDRIPLL